mmetsp:Transcript_53080/g.84640  ORF Transcript_53080/g.84640 Transcript_53080/m.84640 type:complete len:108 (+) Transcript_53080:2253-2576(+)
MRFRFLLRGKPCCWLFVSFSSLLIRGKEEADKDLTFARVRKKGKCLWLDVHDELGLVGEVGVDGVDDTAIMAEELGAPFMNEGVRWAEAVGVIGVELAEDARGTAGS